MTKKIKVGKTVTLKSGGQVMTVVAIHAAYPDSAHVVWFDRDGRLHQNDFPLCALRRCPVDEEIPF
ncbi:DUF2158 domain-containing protein [uncultured Salipiger sp.]|uniref:DUF2158 domain-containing protein n=1 Tax=uncultured Salipiger sp. TaxID=499810 RepID=UPI00259A946A|nr:DUF2158 domain-containing protein [uncultured Salipiger sp.]